MKRSAAIITATLAALAFSSCSTIRQLHLAPESNTPTPTTVYVVDIGTPLAPPVVESVTVISTPDCEDLQSGACLPCDGMEDCASNVPSGTTPADNSDCSPEGLEVGVCEDAVGVSN